MRARVLEFGAPRRVEWVEVEVAPPGPGAALVRTLFSGISSGTEMLAYRGEIAPDTPLDDSLAGLAGAFGWPFRYGYSCVGVVEDGDAPEGARVFAFHPHQTHFVQDASQLIPLGDLDPRGATLFPLVETALQVTLDAGPVTEELVVVCGLGAVGLLVAALLRRAGAHVIASEPRPWRRALAARWGLHAVAPEQLPNEVEVASGGRGAPLLVEASGAPAALAGGLSLLAHEGTALVVSWYGTKEVSLALGAEFHRRRLCLLSSQVSTIPARLAGRWSIERRRRVARDLLAELTVHDLATHTFAWGDAPAAFRAVDAAEDGFVHAALRY
jgi:2-desacetyl-2-hydroxyethyl bacteriochlorophyllide A dehydrogenase